MVKKPQEAFDFVQGMAENCPDDYMGDTYFAMVALVKYCEELEAENKRLGARCVELADEFQIDLAARIEKD